MTALLHAEQAVLGAVLLDPGQLPRLSGWLRPEHFYRPAHATLYRALRDLHAAEHPGTSPPSGPPATGRKPGAWPAVPQADAEAQRDGRLAWMDAALTKANTEVRGLTVSYLHTLIASCPRPAHAAVYGRMVLEGAIHRAVAEHATRLHHTARTDTARGAAEDTLHQLQVLNQVLDDVARRWGTDPRPAPPPAPTSPAGERPVVPERVLADEQYLLAVLTARPDGLGAVVGWLRPEDFADPVHAGIYRCLGALHHRGEPVDEVTVLWEAQRRGALTDHTLTPDDVLRLCATSAAVGDPDFLGEKVLTAALARTAADAARQIRALADDPALAPGRLISYALHVLAPVDDLRRRLQSAADPSLAPSARPVPPPAARVRPERAEAARARSRHHPTPPTPSDPPLAAVPAARSPRRGPA
ncbi:DnaB-like helicase N-terminal domain-containing protein [Streptomyces sp. B1866]|uniref:DnaB-like helicase N-terminal domain-containing protein n=1 Tax=Streptomyces sp. B1866 TaxID=3075431 RepID=UPI0028923747|nr:DnaB-like helicase N-terminal domain-containing protein [Streptomyces sp. B1866]MDT3395327.1 DnaB-like helicase N-terminal domain-containing protein [Streptomyces sp. B1866]